MGDLDGLGALLGVLLGVLLVSVPFVCAAHLVVRAMCYVAGWTA